MSEQHSANTLLKLSVNATDSTAPLSAGRSASDETIPADAEGFAAHLSGAMQNMQGDTSAGNGPVEYEQTAQDEFSLVPDAADQSRSLAGDGTADSAYSNHSKLPANGMVSAAADSTLITDSGVLTNREAPVAVSVATGVAAGTVQFEGVDAVESGDTKTLSPEPSVVDLVRRGQDMPTPVVTLTMTGDGDNSNALAMQSAQPLFGTAGELTNEEAPPSSALATAGHDSLVYANSLQVAQSGPGRAPLTATATGEVSRLSSIVATDEKQTTRALNATQLAGALSSALESGDKSVAGPLITQINTDGVKRGKVTDRVDAGLLSADAVSLTTPNDEAAGISPQGVLHSLTKTVQQVTWGVTSQVTPMTDTSIPQQTGLTGLLQAVSSPTAAGAKATSQQTDATNQSIVIADTTGELETLTTESIAVASDQQLEIESASVVIGSRVAQGGFSEPANMFHATASGIVAAPVSQRNNPGIELPVAPQLVSLSSGNTDEAMLDNVRWMIGENVRSATVNVTPAGMGQISIKVDMESEQVSVSIVAGQGATREALDAALPRLREQLMLQGHESVRVEINDGRSEHSRTSEEGKRFMDNSKQNVNSEEDEQEAYSSNGERQPVHARARGLVDAYA